MDSSRAYTICLVWISFLCADCSYIDARELLENGSFDADSPPFFIIADTGWDDGPALSNDTGFATDLWPYFENGVPQSGNSAFELPPGLLESDFSGVLRPIGAGNVFGRSWGAANGSGDRGSATQIVEVTNFAGRPYHFSAWLASVSDERDFAIVSLEFFRGPSAGGEVLATLVFDGNDPQSTHIFGSLNASGFADPTIPATRDNWTLYSARGTVPSLAASAAVLIRGAVPLGDVGFGNDAYVDLVSLQIAPEPSSAILLALLLSVLLITQRDSIRGWLKTKSAE